MPFQRRAAIGSGWEGQGGGQKAELGDTPPGHNPGRASGPGWMGSDAGRSLSPYGAFGPALPRTVRPHIDVSWPPPPRVGPANVFFGRMFLGGGGGGLCCFYASMSNKPE